MSGENLWNANCLFYFAMVAWSSKLADGQEANRKTAGSTWNTQGPTIPEEEPMFQKEGMRKSVLWILVALGSVALTTGCASRKYVRTRVDDSSHELSARMDTDKKELSSSINATTHQVDELNGVAREHSQKLGALDEGLKQTDGKAQQALTTGETAQNTANKAATEVGSLDNKFQNRNHYAVLNEEQVRFKFNSAKLEPDFKKTLDDIAQQLKQNPDAILVMEGHTDSTGPEDYNIQLGQKRLDAVVRYLVVDQEVPVNRISNLSFGKEKPMAENKTKDGRAQNRSVIVRVMGPQLSGGMVSQTRP
jgi:outer membrane protein OmpA-like peptidoglycan-associated protein